MMTALPHHPHPPNSQQQQVQVQVQKDQQQVSHHGPQRLHH
jgi:hypothetical protein